METGLEWAEDSFQGYKPGLPENSGKIQIMFQILEQAVLRKEKTLVFSQSLETLNMVERMLQAKTVPGSMYGDEWEPEQSYVDGHFFVGSFGSRCGGRV
jgi:hypothetical protein